MLATFLIVAITLVFPYTPLAHVFGFRPLSGSFLIVLFLIMLFYIGAAETAKYFFYRAVSETNRKFT